jgi:hypothetical protein
MSDPALARSVGPCRGWRHLNLACLTALTAWSAGLGWQAQAVSYPLYRAVGDQEFARYHQQYNRSIPVVVIVPGFASFLAGVAFYWTRPAEVPRSAAVVVAAAGGTSLAATVLRAIPMHNRLDDVGRSDATIDSLLRANLVRTVALTGSTLTLIAAVWRSLGGAGAPRP